LNSKGPQMLASEQSIKSMQFTLVPELSGNPGSNGDKEC
jgi:hypothetical protein